MQDDDALARPHARSRAVVPGLQGYTVQGNDALKMATSDPDIGTACSNLSLQLKYVVSA